MKISKNLPIIFHNLIGYDSHLIIKELSKFFLSMFFLNSSLDKLDNNLNEFKYLNKVFKGNKFDLVKKKGIYPYEYMENFEKLKKIICLMKNIFLIL